jgi:pimeloyl-ACP methyl ester carboxylesterase
MAIVYAGICLAVFKFQRSLIYYPQPRQVIGPESTMTLHGQGAELIVTVRPHTGPRAIIYFGGNAEDVSLNLESFSKAFPEYALFFLHYRGYGGSTGSPSEQTNNSDAVALFRKVHSRYPDVAIIGRSLGTGIAIRLASQSLASRLILVTPFDSLEEIAAAAYPYLPVKLLLLDRYESWKYAPLIKMPTMIIAAQNDDVIPRASTEKLFAKFPAGVASMVVVEGVGHNDIGAKSEYLKIIQSALQ